MDIPGDRDFFYTSHQSLFGPIHPAEIKMADQLGQVLARLLPEETELVCPLTLGDHVDHKLTRAALEKLGRPLWYYADFPYAINCLERIEALERSGWRSQIFQVSEEGMEAWKQAAAGHQSQISSFWPDSKAMEKELEYYREFFGGVMLFNPRISSKKE